MKVPLVQVQVLEGDEWTGLAVQLPKSLTALLQNLHRMGGDELELVDGQALQSGEGLRGHL